MNLDRTTHKALMAHVWRLQDEHYASFEEVLRMIDGDPNDILRELKLLGLPITRNALKRWIRAQERRSA